MNSGPTCPSYQYQNTTVNLYQLFKVEYFTFSANSGIPASAIGNGVQEFMDGNDEFGEDTHRVEPIAFYQWTQILTLDITIFGLKLSVKSGLKEIF